MCIGHRRVPGGRADAQAAQGTTNSVLRCDGHGRSEGHPRVLIRFPHNSDRCGRKDAMDLATHASADGGTKAVGVCYNCDEKYHRNHNCKQLYLIEFVHYDFEDEEEAAETDSEISLHALTGINTCRTMQLEVRVGDATLTTLVDLGTTHNFASSAVHDRLVLPMQPTRMKDGQ